VSRIVIFRSARDVPSERGLHGVKYKPFGGVGLRKPSNPISASEGARVDKKKLVEVLESVIRRGGSTYLAAEKKLKAVPPAGRGAILRYELGTHITPLLRAQPEFASAELMMAGHPANRRDACLLPRRW